MERPSRRSTAYLRLEVALFFPQLGLWDLSLWTAIIAIILLVSAELLSPYYGRTGILINHRRLRVIAFVLAFIFLSTVAYRIYEIITTP
jgi:hypothetical protein